MTEPLSFFFEGEPVAARPGQSLAAALTEAGVGIFRHTARGSPRGVFCGMGVCQDCLVSVDGAPNRRACMTPVEAGADVRCQVPQPALARAATCAAPEPAPRARELAPEVLVIGAGAGGLHAAAVAARAGARVLVLDERRVPGGQYFKQPAAGAPLLDRQQRDGADLLARARDAGAELLAGVETWGVFAGPVVYAVDAAGVPLILRPQQMIVATGAYERPAMVPGWTLPGVMTTGAAQTLWRSYRTLPGRRIAVCGSGPLNLQVALELARGGADVRLVTEAGPSPLRHPLRALGLFGAGPRLVLAGLGMRAGLLRAGVPLRYGTRLAAVEAMDGTGLRASFEGSADTVEVDVLCMNEGFEPQNEILRLLGAEMRYDPLFGHLRCLRSETMETSVAGVYAIGDCCGLGGAPAAAAEGRIAGAAAARACGHDGGADPVRAARGELARAQRFQQRLWSLHAPAPRSAASLAADAIVCRCEEITAGDLREAATRAEHDIGVLKRATRVGMGCCQGRYCGPVAARVIAASAGRALADHGYFAPRVPIKPVSVGAILATQDTVDARDAAAEARVAGGRAVAN